MNKNDLRSVLRKDRQDFVKQRSSSIFPVSAIVAPHLESALNHATVVAAYLPVGSEADPHDVMAAVRRRGRRMSLPFLSAMDAPMAFRSWDVGDPTETAPGGFQQPLFSHELLEPDLIFLPLLGFDRYGNRIGQGAGHYDRALATRLDALRIGIAWSVQEVSAIPADPWDVPLDAIMTEAEWIVPVGSRLERA